VILKVHGDNKLDSFVITEDHYIEYIERAADLRKLLPVKLAAKLKNSHLLFLGYSLRDWNLRVVLHRLWKEQEGRTFKSWAVQASPDPIDRKAWATRGVEILPVRVEDFVAKVEHQLVTRNMMTP
jgi:hypothetical protein